MSKVFGFSGRDDFCPGGSIYSNPKESTLFLTLGHRVDVYFPPVKRSRISAPFVFGGERFEQKRQTAIESLPDECLFEIFSRLSGGEERSACACVSRRWLMLVSNISRDEICSNKNTETSKHENEISVKGADDQEVESGGYLSRTLEGKKATDVRLASIAVGTACRGGLGKLSIRGSNSDRGVTNLGLRAIAHGCPSLKVLSLWNISTIGDEGLSEIATGCRLLEKLDLSKCPLISDKGLLAVASNCPNLTELSIKSCSGIGNEGLQAIGKCCPNLTSISIKDCSLVSDQGISSLVSSIPYVLRKVKLQTLNITDVSLAVIGHYGLEVTELVLTGLPNVSERGFWIMGNGHGLQKLKSFTIASCQGITDLGLDAIGKGCPNLKHFCLRKCAILSDNGLVSFANAAVSLESLQLEECHRITQFGFFGLLLNCRTQLKSLTIVSCFGIEDFSVEMPSGYLCESLQSLSVCYCPGFGDANLSALGELCPQLRHVEFCGLEGITDDGFLPLFESSDAGLLCVNVRGCINLTDKFVLSLANQHGWTLEMLNLDGCKKISDASLVAIAENCPLLSDLNVSKCAINDAGVEAIACADQFSLQILSLSGCSSVSDKCLPALGKLGQTLLGLNLQHCNAISSSTVSLLVDHLWRCDILF
ncbi:EIN3-binding F-box protein 1 [Quillaja saponaria]|uniref:EIN3-binding F-box protein 1 n=1 Tax=Quillaja saponaria TaxID=32244 RepID=A0AAD7LII7_QUISA|nr:EIN3-binding F-box protein 1 [Quillaja saponaria]